MTMIRFANFLFTHAPGASLLMLGAGILSGAAGAGVLIVINRFLHRPHDGTWLLVLFGLLVLTKMAATTFSQILVVRFSQDAIIKLSLALCERISTAPLELLERKGTAQLLTVLTDDVSWVVWALQCTPQLIMNGAVIVGCGLYLTWLSWQAAAGVAAITVVGAVGYQLLHSKTFDYIHASRESRAILFRRFRELTDGIKELLMNRARRDEFVLGEIRQAADEYRRLNLSATSCQALMDAWAHGLFYLMLGLLMGVFAHVAQLEGEALTGYVFAMLYIMGPVWGVIGAVPTVSRGRVGLEKIEELGGSLTSLLAEPARRKGDRNNLEAPVTIELVGVTYVYPTGVASEPGFRVGPFDLRMRSGEIIFVVGGNGAGKSTFVKLVTGLYAPTSGELRLNGKPVAQDEIDSYRQMFAAVFSDFMLFDKLYGIPEDRVSSQAHEYLRLLEMQEKVTMRGKTFSTTALSQGQRKRLALVNAFLEDRAVYVLDEWAADQDPHYKDMFYRTFLPELRRQGKLVIVITHDDRYFNLGDRVVKIEDGRVAGVQNIRTDPMPAAL